MELNGSTSIITRRKPQLDETEEYEVLESKKTPMWKKVLNSYIDPCRSCSNFSRTLLSFFPWLKWIPKYSMKDQLFGDVIGGIMAGIMNITQGIAYAFLAGVPAVNGLYTTFLCACTYPIFASWPHGSLGPFAIIELMSGAAARKIMKQHHLPTNSIDSMLNGTNFDMQMLEEINPSTIISTLTFMNGFVCIAFGVLHLHFLMDYFSEALVSGFITAVSLHVFITQLDTLIGVNKPRSAGFGYIFVDLYELYNRVNQINYVTIAMSIGSFVFLIMGKFLVTNLIKKIFSLNKLILPWELILVILTTSIAYFLQLDKTYNLQVVGDIPRGFPVPSLPKFGLIPELIYDSIAISITQIAFHMSIAKVMSTKCKYHVDENQELYAIGASLVFTGFFPVFPGTNGLGRPIILKECGASSQISCVISGLVVLLVLLALGPLLYCLPLCVLAIIVLIAIRSLLNGFCELPRFWNLSKWDVMIWLVVFFASMITDVIGGLAIGVLFQLFTVVSRTQWPKWNARFSKQKHNVDLCIFDFQSILLFSNSEHFVRAVRKVLIKWNASGLGKGQRTFIFNLNAVTEIDTMGLQSLKQVANELRNAACVVYFTCVGEHILKSIKKIGALTDENHVFYSVEDAIWEAKLPTDHMSLIIKSSNPFDMDYISTKSMPFTNL